jgi:hypothetical protein
VVQPSPPGTKTTWRITKPKVGIQDEAIDTVVAAVKQIGVVVGELIGGHSQHTIRAQFGGSTARRATFSEPRLRKSVDSIGTRFLDIAAIKQMILGEYPLIQIHSPWR